MGGYIFWMVGSGTLRGLVRVPSISKRQILRAIGYDLNYYYFIENIGMDPDEELEEIIEHKIMKVNGEIGYKKYQRGKLLGKGMI